MVGGSEGSSSSEGTSRGWETITLAPLRSWKSSRWERAPYDSVQAPSLPGVPGHLGAILQSGERTLRHRRHMGENRE